MAVRYAVATGNWSDTATWDGGTLPGTGDDVYANGLTVTIDVDVTVLSIRNSAISPVVAGGGFVCGAGRTLNFTGLGVVQSVQSSTALTFNHSSGSSQLNGNVWSNARTDPKEAVLINNAGTVNFAGNISHIGNVIVNAGFRITNGGTLNMIGDIILFWAGNQGVVLTNNSTLNHTGNINLSSTFTANTTQPYNIAASIVNFTGNYTINNMNTGGDTMGIVLNAGGRLDMVGNIVAEASSIQTNIRAINCLGTTTYLKIVGSLTSNLHPLIKSLTTTSINLFSGPFICGESGIFPLEIFRMNLIKTIGTYFEFRDSTTDGALPPSSPAPSTRLVSPDTVVDAPIPANVRDGISYALATLTGTLKVPSTASVAFGVPVDNTTGVALLTGDSWIAAISSSNDPFAERLRNVATVQTTAAQIAAF
jgi:hypothetical protein